MASKSLGTLTLDLVAKVGGFEKGMDQAARISEKRLQQIATKAAALGNTFGTYLTRGIDKVASTLYALTKGAIDNADQLGKLSQKVGIATEELSKLSYAAKLADVDTASLQQGLVKLSKAAIDSKDGLGDSAAAFAALGVSVTDAQGNLKSTQELFEDTAEAFSQFADGPEKAAAAVAIFGKAGADLIPLLNGGKKAIHEAGDELAKFGGVITQEVAKAADDFNDNLDRLKVSTEALGLQVSAKLLPGMVDLTDQFVAFVKEGDSAEDIADGLDAAFRVLGGTAVVVGNAFQIVGDNIAAFAAIAVSVIKGDFSGALEIAKLRVADLKTDVNDITHAFDASGKAAAKAGEEIAKAAGKGKLGFDPEAAAKAAAANKKAAEEALKHAEDIQKQVEALQEQAATLGLSSEQLAVYRLAANGASEAQLDLARAALATIAAFDKSQAIKETIEALELEGNTVALTARELVAYKLALQGASDGQIAAAVAIQDHIDKQNELKNLASDAVSVFDSTRTAAERYAITLEKLQELRNTLGEDGKPLIDEETFERAKDAAKEFDETFRGSFEAYADSVKDVGAALGGDLVSALDSAISRTADLAANTILWGEGGTEALKELGRSIITDVVAGLIRAGVQMAVNFALGKALGAAATGVALGEAATVAGAWAPAAYAASVATLGAAPGVGLGSYLGGLASAEAATLAFGTFAEGGFTGMGGRNQIAGVVHGQEGVVSAGALRAAADAINDPDFWGGGKGSQIKIINQPGVVTIRQDDGSLLNRLAPQLLEMVDVDQASRTATGLGRNAQAIGNKFGVQGRAQR